MPTSRSVAMMTTASRVASTLTFVSTGLGDRDGTTADALCKAASNDSLGQRIFIVGKGPQGRSQAFGEAPYCTRKTMLRNGSSCPPCARNVPGRMARFCFFSIFEIQDCKNQEQASKNSDRGTSGMWLRTCALPHMNGK